ncbi:HYR-like domain-containing protein [Robertkochia aurantiaca]|uniref:HYR-like domain-containing protein n=1 Tax=Robertkochia aurantiaca TaxID=2873700 RepID=UPI001CCD6236|nr:gliding motility-associated C-terminal domain-containing protein [Robertkochia sp. 3YJGBD-33]
MIGKLRCSLVMMIVWQLTGFGQEIRFDGDNCAPGGATEWGTPHHVDTDINGDGYGDPDTTPGSADVLHFWSFRNTEYLYLAFERVQKGNSYFSFYLNTDCNTSTGDPSRDGADIAVAFDIKPNGNKQEITDNLIYRWNGSSFESTGLTFEAKIGKESCTGDLGKFFELRLPLSDIFDVCNETNPGCSSLAINLGSAQAGGSPNSALKDLFDLPANIGINSVPTPVITAGTVFCVNTEVTFDGSASQPSDLSRSITDDADFIESFEWDLDYDGSNFVTRATGAIVNQTFTETGNKLIALRVTDRFGCSRMTTLNLDVYNKPEAAFEVNKDPDCDMQFSFDASNSTDASGGNNLDTYEWDFNYDGTFTVDASGSTTTYTYPECGEFTVALRVTDNGSPGECSQAITTQTIVTNDNQAPDFEVPGQIEVTNQQEAENLAVTGEPSNITDNCGNIEVGYQDKKKLDKCGAGSITRTWTVSDACGNTTEKEQIILVSGDENVIELTAPADITLSCPGEYLPCMDFENVADPTQIPLLNKKVIVTAGTEDNSFMPGIFPSSSPTSADPDLGTPHQDFNGPGIGEGGASGSIYANFRPRNDILIVQNPASNYPNDLNLDGVYLSFDFSEFDGVNLASVSLLDIEPSHNRHLELYDSNGDLVGNLPIPPAGDNGAVTIDLTGNNNIYTLKVVLSGSGAVTGICFNNNILPEEEPEVNFTCNAPVGTYYEDEWVQNECGVQQINRTWYAVDENGKIVSDTQQITFIDQEAPVFAEDLPENITVTCDEIPDAAVLTATDNCSGTVDVTFEETIDEDAACSETATITRTWTATDCAGNTATHVQTIEVTDEEAPVFTEDLPADASVSCGSIPEAAVLTATDNCSGSIDVTFEETIVEDTACSETATITRTWTATDCAGNTVTHVQTIKVTDEEAPVFTEDLPADASVSCGSIPEAAVLTATDNCSGSIDVTFEETIVEDAACSETATITRTWTATDCAGNTATHVQTIEVTDEEAPVFTEDLPADASVSCGSIPEAAVLTATDNCSGSVDVTFEETIVEDAACSETATITRTWTATDCAGNTATHVQTIEVTDEEAPVFTEDLPADASVSCGSIPEAAVLTATDNCSGSIDVTFEETTQASNECEGLSTITRTWTATDCAGNTATHVQTIEVTDEEAPVFTEDLPADASVSCGSIPEAAVLTATDNCSGSIDVTFEETTQASSECEGLSTITRTWTATDCTGNTATHVQTIEVTDEEAPVFLESLPDDIVISCGEIPAAPVLTAFDDCSGNVEVNFNEIRSDNDNSCEEVIITRTWSASDCNGNTVTHTQQVTISDEEAPVLQSEIDQNIMVSCDAIPEVPEVVFTDNCSAEVAIAFEEIVHTDIPGNDYDIERIWTASDNCGNTTVFIQEIFVMGSTPELPTRDLRICPEDGPVDLFSEVDDLPASGGSWESVDGNAMLNGSEFDPTELNPGLYRFLYTTLDGNCRVTVPVNVTVRGDCVVLPCTSEKDIFISKAITPNGDGHNDFFEVRGISEQCGFKISVMVFNRWGDKVFESANYKNNWDGSTTGMIGGSSHLPAGTYYYIVKLAESGLDPFTGYIYLGTAN